MHITIGGALIRDEGLPGNVEEAAFCITVVIILRCVRRIVNGPVAPRAPRSHQVLFRRLIFVSSSVGRVVKLGNVYVRAHAVCVIGTHKIGPPEALAIQSLDFFRAKPDVGGAHGYSGGGRGGRR